jgi:hypothetical protein
MLHMFPKQDEFLRCAWCTVVSPKHIILKEVKTHTHMLKQASGDSLGQSYSVAFAVDGHLGTCHGKLQYPHFQHVRHLKATACIRVRTNICAVYSST